MRTREVSRRTGSGAALEALGLEVATERWKVENLGGRGFASTPAHVKAEVDFLHSVSWSYFFLKAVAAGVFLSLKDVAASQCVSSCGAATLSSHDSSFRRFTSGLEATRGCAVQLETVFHCSARRSNKFFVIGLIVVLSHHRWSLKISAVNSEV